MTQVPSHFSGGGGAPDHDAAYLENQDGFEIEQVANSGPAFPIIT